LACEPPPRTYFPGMDSMDPYRAAKMLIDLHGDHAKAHAAQRLFEMRILDDEAGARAWMRVLDAIIALRAIRPANGDAVH
jgi:hypothetical protein